MFAKILCGKKVQLILFAYLSHFWLNYTVIGLYTGNWALWAYCLGPCTGKSYCHWYFCRPLWLIVLMQKELAMYVFSWINQLWAGPFGPTVWGPVQAKVAVMAILQRNDICQVLSMHNVQLNKPILGPPILRPPGRRYRMWPGSNTDCGLLAHT